MTRKTRDLCLRLLVGVLAGMGTVFVLLAAVDAATVFAGLSILSWMGALYLAPRR